MKALTETEFNATFGNPMKPLTPDCEPPFDFWPYFDALDEEEFGGHDFSAGNVASAYRDPWDRYEHVLVSCGDRDVFFVMVLDLKQSEVYGHRLLNLNEEYGLEDRKPEGPEKG